MARRQRKVRRHPFPRAHGMAHAFVDALVRAERESVTISQDMQKAIVRGVNNATGGTS